MPMQDKERTLDMITMVINGEKIKDVAAKYGLSPSRVSHLCYWMKRMLLHPNNRGGLMVASPYCSLSDMKLEKGSWLMLVKTMRDSIND